MSFVEEIENGEDMEPVDSSPWAGSDRDYTYEEVGISSGGSLRC